MPQRAERRNRLYILPCLTGFATPGSIGSISASSGNPTSWDNFKISRKVTINLGARWDADFNLQGGNVRAQSRHLSGSDGHQQPLGGETAEQRPE